VSGSNPWAEYATADGIRLGTRRQDLVSVMGPPERTVTGGGSTSFYYDRRGIRFTLSDTGPLAGKVGSMRVVWRSVPHGDTTAVPGKRISSVEVGMPVEQALALLGGGYHKGEAAPGVHVYAWPHLGLSFVERSGSVMSVRAGSQLPADAPGILYGTVDGLGRGSTAAQIKAVLGEPSRTDTSLPLGEHWWIFRARGIAFGLDNEGKVRLVDVFPPETQ
jgi:outer membrane protein assembly factor BamE (lipoprotein component of BamABCDE complex)